MERELQLSGITAIEDKLQDGVPATIQTLLMAGIKASAPPWGARPAARLCSGVW